MAANGEWVVWLNGELVPEHQAVVPIRDRGFKYGDAAFDTTRTFGHRIFKLEEHLDRFYRSLRYLQIDPGVSRDTLVEATEAVAAKCLKCVGEADDIWLTQRVTRGLDPADRARWPDYPERTVIVEAAVLPLRQRSASYKNGLRVATPSVRRPSTDAVSPRAKTHNYLNLVLADLEVQARDPDALAVLLDDAGNFAEGKGSNIFFVRDGAILTPKEQNVLPGVSRQTTMDLAAEAGLRVEEADLDMFDAYSAEESFVTSTSFCICPVASINGVTVGDGAVPGPITRQLIDAYVKFVDFDWYGQYLRAGN